MNKQIHGSIPYALLREYGIRIDAVVDFSATVNPFPPHEKVNHLLAATDLHAYPDSDCYDARCAIADFHRVPVECVVMAAGTTELLFALPLLFRNAACFSPSYGDYEEAFLRNGMHLKPIPFADSDDLLRMTIDTVLRNQTDLLIICNPNNPTGNYLTPEAVSTLCASIPYCMVCIDESYQELGDECRSVASRVNDIGNCIVLKSLSKPYGIGGLRAGYAVASEGWCRTFRTKLLPWGVSTPAQRMVPVLFSLYEHFRAQWQSLIAERNKMIGVLDGLGYTIGYGSAPFFLVEVEDAAALRLSLVKNNNMVVRDCTSFGMPRKIRIMPSLPEHNSALLEVLSALAGSRNSPVK